MCIHIPKSWTHTFTFSIQVISNAHICPHMHSQIHCTPWILTLIQSYIHSSFNFIIKTMHTRWMNAIFWEVLSFLSRQAGQEHRVEWHWGWDSRGYIGSIKALISSTILWTNFNQAFISVDCPRTDINSIIVFLQASFVFTLGSIFFSGGKLILAVTRAHPP